MTEPNYDAERKLPEGKTCAHCQHGKICDKLFGAVRLAFNSCDFWPSRFRPHFHPTFPADVTVVRRPMRCP